jgi:hypothetical protein
MKAETNTKERRCFMMKEKKGTSKLAFILSVVALILAALVSLFKMHLWLAGTQWILIAILFAIYAVYAKGCNCDCCKKE